MSIDRRVFLRGAAASSVVGVAVGAGLITPRAVLAAWPKDAFDARSVSAAMNSLFSSEATAESSDIEIKAPDIAENGAVVPVSVTTSLSDIESITIVAEKNPVPLSASFNLASNAQGYVSTRIKMGKTQNIMAVVKSGGKLYSAKKEVKVTIGGCGG